MHLNATILHADNLSEKSHLLLQTYLNTQRTEMLELAESRARLSATRP